MKRAVPILLIAVLAMGAVADAQAQSTAEPGPSDPRIRVIDYDPWAVVSVVGVFRTATQILFGEDESILHVAVGDATGWDVVAEGNILFLKPKTERALTNLIVTTRRGQTSRHYTFELRSRGGSSSNRTSDTVYGLRFRYPDDETANTSANLDAEAVALERRLIELKLDRAVVEGQRNLAYSVHRPTELDQHPALAEEAARVGGLDLRRPGFRLLWRLRLTGTIGDVPGPCRPVALSRAAPGLPGTGRRHRTGDQSPRRTGSRTGRRLGMA